MSTLLKKLPVTLNIPARPRAGSPEPTFTDLMRHTREIDKWSNEVERGFRVLEAAVRELQELEEAR